MTATTDARLEIVTAYIADGLTAFGYTPATVVPPVIVVEPANPWLTPTRTGGEFRAAMGMTATVYVNLIDPTTALDALEALVEKVIAATPDGVLVTSVDAPVVDDTPAQGNYLTASVNLTAQIRN